MTEETAPERPFAVFGRLIRNLRLRKGLSQTDFAKEAGLTRTYISRIEGGDRRPSPRSLKRISVVVDVPLEELLIRSGHLEEEPPEWAKPVAAHPVLRGRAGPKRHRAGLSPAREHALAVPEEAPGVRTIPLLDSIPAGLVAPEEKAERAPRTQPKVVVSDTEIEHDPEAFGLTVTGDSMEGGGMLDGDIAVVSPNAEVSDGDTVVVMLGDHDVSLKRIYFVGDRVLLQPGNVAYRPITLKYPDEVEILGKVVLLKRMLG